MYGQTSMTMPGATLAATGAATNTLALMVAGFALLFAGLAVLKLLPKRR
ncbi:LPXTG cell wall anchor domain-containing protein [Kribbella solani]|uniref:LPXTG-motif cell wall-anchored protein n=1 Tax=Kribbella solani TaxID=236067 RepID=A0A841DW48_9ACTN|nr:LPXTG cell wall anchor domain-containing protein [Kribbella solani]MBB5982191.1 LPXTG-motif cell wall-anchored protein [Kribbella solani]MDX2968217.1 LPXTG cell wall anchor domain-containing protein [Kribbella solani]MDX3003947.1 LPXTG cell wall anchor domain-containing protein [Kribbella solani]